MLRFVFDSDGDTDADTDACGNGSRPGSSTFLLVSARHVAYATPTRSGATSSRAHLDPAAAGPAK
jgi:hypothetical protein